MYTWKMFQGNQYIIFLILKNQRTGGLSRSWLGDGINGREDVVGKGSKSVNIVEILSTHVFKWKNETC
jgi:hypothetical protein